MIDSFIGLALVLVFTAGVQANDAQQILQDAGFTGGLVIHVIS